MDASKRHEILGSEVKNSSISFMAIAAVRLLAFMLQYPRFQFPHSDTKSAKGYLYT